MKLAIFGLTVSSSWGNGHATLWRGLIAALSAQGHTVTFFERDVPYYAQNRDLADLPHPATLVLYRDWADVQAQAGRCTNEADAAIVTSFCPDAIAATDMVLASRAGLRCFYDLDTPVTLDRLAAGQDVPYIGATGLSGFDLVLSYTGGAALEALRTQLGARRTAPLYGWADPSIYRPVPTQARYAADLSYLGTYAADRQAALEALFVAPAMQRPHARFVIGGAQYPQDFPWTDNIFFVRHLPPPEHPAFYGSSRITLNVTRASMARMGWCPSGRLFEAAACGTPILSDAWTGLDTFFEPGREIMVASSTQDTLAALDTAPETLARIAVRARGRMLAEHTAAHRARTLVDLLQTAPSVVEA
jgi:spore maturation protein CgeB